MLSVKNLTKKYGDTTVVDKLSFTLKKGELVAILGPNGAGKTTVMRMITGFVPPTDGAVVINGVDLKINHLEAKKNIGYLPEVPPLYPEMRVDGFLRYIAKLKGLNKEKLLEALDNIIKRCSLEDVRNQFIYTLSKGYRQRVGLAQALLGDSPFLVLDEPTSGLDPAQIIEMREFVKSLKESHTILLSTHILTEVSQVCDRVLILHKGRLVGDGLIEEFSKDRSLEETYMSLVAYS